ncbi:MAG: serine/threonine-protein kinase [Acidobacteriota bacterium]
MTLQTMTLPPERWQRAWELFDEAVELPVAERATLLDARCAKDPELRQRVEAWLRADADAADFLGDDWLAHEVLAAPDLVGRQLDNCRILRRLGQGGMGTVYLAHQQDAIFDREVAIKVLSWLPFGDEARRRFQTEAQALGRLDHPSVARIFAGGTTDEGFPYLVLEYVPGQPLDAYCRHHGLSLKERVVLMRRVCQGVSAAHQRLIVHSDLKPSNILVRDEGQPKLLDFGIATLLEPGSADDAGAALMRPLTPHYASPEQLRGEPLSTASDVYSLGVILHQVLCDVLPTSDVLPVSVDGPEKPSAYATDRKLARALSGDLDAIVLAAMSPEPEARTPSVQSLDEDLGRYLEGLPVRARRGGRGYRMLRFLSRHRWPVATAAAALAALLTFSGALWLDARRVEQERSRLQEVARFFFGVFEQAGPLVSEGVDVSLQEALDRSSQHLAAGPPDEPRIHAALVSVLGEIYLELGQPEKALSWSRQAHRLHTELGGASSREAAVSLDTLGAAQRELGNLEQAEAAHRDAVAALRAAPDVDPRLLIRSLNNQVHLECWRGNYQDALPASHEVLALARAKLASDDAEAVESLLLHAQVISHAGDPQIAIERYREVRAILERQYPGGHPSLAKVHNNLARIYGQQGRGEDRVAALERADQLYAQLFGPDFYERVKPLGGLAVDARDRGDLERAHQLYQQAAAIGRQTTSFSYILRPTAAFARFLLTQSRCAEAEAELRASLALLLERERKPWRYFDAQSLLGESLHCQGRTAEAEIELRLSLEGLEPFSDSAAASIERTTRLLAQLNG